MLALFPVPTPGPLHMQFCPGLFHGSPPGGLPVILSQIHSLCISWQSVLAQMDNATYSYEPGLPRLSGSVLSWRSMPLLLYLHHGENVSPTSMACWRIEKHPGNTWQVGKHRVRVSYYEKPLTDSRACLLLMSPHQQASSMRGPLFSLFPVPLRG